MPETFPFIPLIFFQIDPFSFREPTFIFLCITLFRTNIAAYLFFTRFDSPGLLYCVLLFKILRQYKTCVFDTSGLTLVWRFLTTLQFVKILSCWVPLSRRPAAIRRGCLGLCQKNRGQQHKMSSNPYGTPIFSYSYCH